MIGAFAKEWILVVLKLLGYLLIFSGFSLQLCNCFSSNSGPGPIFFLSGYLLLYFANLFRKKTDIICFDLIASITQIFGLSLAVFAQFNLMICGGNKFFTWVGLAGSYLMVLGALLYAWNLYKMQTNKLFRRYIARMAQ